MARSGRLISLDIFRGLTVAFMIIVNTPGSWEYVYPPLRHSVWHGCTPTDLVFPFFLFIVGMSTWFSMKKYGHELNGSSFLRITRRTLSIFTLGLFLNFISFAAEESSAFRIMGVLQRIALAYFAGALICMTIRRNYLWIVTAALLLIYWVVLGVFGGPAPYSLEGNVVLKVDKLIIGSNHLYSEYGIPFDPEGLLSTVPAVCTVIIGYFVGELVGKGSARGKDVLKIMIIGASLTGLGLLWNKLFPINKPLWTSSYVLYTAGMAMVILAIIYWLADVLKFRKWGSFFMVFGTNALFSYFMAGVWAGSLMLIKMPLDGNEINLYTWIFEKICVPVAGNMGGSLMFAIIQMLLVWFIALILYRKKVMIRL
jgi:predicted acyltransferase